MWEETRRIFVESMEEVLRATARILPSILAMLLFFVLAAVLATVARWVVRRACERLSLDQRLREWGVVTPDRDGRPAPSRLVAGLSFWAVLLAGAFLGVSALNAPAVASLSMRLVEYLPRAVLAIVVLGAGLAAARFVERSVLIGAVNMGLESARVVALGARWLVVLLAAAGALEQAGMGSDVVTVAFGALFGGISLAFGLAIGLGARDLVAQSLGRRFGAKPPDGGAEAAERSRLRHL